MNSRNISVGLVLVVVPVLLGCSQFANPIMKPPVVVSVRDSLVSRGKVLIITNTSKEHLHQVQVSVAANPSRDLPERKAVVAEALSPHQQTQVGWLELADRPLVAGDRVSISCHEYGHELTITIPETSVSREAAK